MSGSQQISRAWLEGVTHFSCCGAPIKRLKDVAEVRKLYWRDGDERLVFCYACRRKMA